MNRSLKLPKYFGIFKNSNLNYIYILNFKNLFYLILQARQAQKFVLQDEDFPSLSSSTPTPPPHPSTANTQSRVAPTAKPNPPPWRPEPKAAAEKVEVK
jgi:hypothetical protein